MKKRGFEKISLEVFKKNSNLENYLEVYNRIIMPSRKTKNSAGYDIVCPIALTLKPKEERIIYTGLKAFMQSDEFLGIHIRSSTSIMKHIILVNVVGIIDADYYNNIGNEGHIMLVIKNISDQPVTIDANERIAQAIFQKFLVVDEDYISGERVGGFGSTNEEQE